ncbi:MAG: polar amino acid transport system permease protein [Thermomicrobiales bacterium]|nr:polar amino acid transport system permease protein [Thermomicrobiales bacterium]MEA2595489.1 polar amino acid transport system permease protein [Thermomicrobiales bacterium]
MQVVIDNFDLLMRGLRKTLELSALIIAFGSAIGLLGGVGLLYAPRAVRWGLRGYVDVVRGTPLLVLIFLIFYGFPAFDVEISGFRAATVSFSLFAGAHISEIVRGALSTVPRGQSDAAKSIGLTFWPRLSSVLLPQALPIILPPWVNTAVEMVKGTSLVVLVSVNDLMFATVKVAERTMEPMPLYIAAAVIYFIVNFSISRLGIWLERRLKRRLAGA